MERRNGDKIVAALIVIVVLLGLVCLNSGCATLAGVGRDLQAASEGIARASVKGD